MIEASASASKIRKVNIDSAIDASSFQLPVFVALTAAGGEAQVVKTFATARKVFDHVFCVMLDRHMQRHAVEKVVKLVPTSAHLNISTNTDYVLIVRGKAIFWFSGAAAKRAAARRLLMEHARELADAEQAPFYVLGTRARKRRAAVIALGLVLSAGLGILLWRFATDIELPVQRPVARQVGPAFPSPPKAQDWHFSAGDDVKDTHPNDAEPIPDFGASVGRADADEAVPGTATGTAMPSRRARATSPWLRGVTRPAKDVYPRRRRILDHSTTTGDTDLRPDPVGPRVGVRASTTGPILREAQVEVGTPTPGRAPLDDPRPQSDARNHDR